MIKKILVFLVATAFICLIGLVISNLDILLRCAVAIIVVPFVIVIADSIIQKKEQ